LMLLMNPTITGVSWPLISRAALQATWGRIKTQWVWECMYHTVHLNYICHGCKDRSVISNLISYVSLTPPVHHAESLTNFMDQVCRNCLRFRSRSNA
jgi:hypothetical protein